jgi:phosphatidylinositol 4-kinase A
MRRRPDLRDIYLQELLVLFIDKGVGIQTIATSHQHRKVRLNPEQTVHSLSNVCSWQTDALIAQLLTLVLPIAALLEHPDFTPDTEKAPELVGLFRNMWFLCILFRFTAQTTTGSGDCSRSAQQEALSHIATKTPPLVREEEQDYVTSALEYNSVIRQDYVQNVRCLFDIY